MPFKMFNVLPGMVQLLKLIATWNEERVVFNTFCREFLLMQCDMLGGLILKRYELQTIFANHDSNKASHAVISCS